VSVCSLWYPACNAHSSYYVICGLSPSTLYFHFIPQTPRLKTTYVFRFSLQLSSETFLILRRTERDMITNEYRFSIHFLSCSFQFLSILHKCRSLKVPSGKFFLPNLFINSLQVPSFVSPFHISHLKPNESLYIPLTRSELPCLLVTIAPSSHVLSNILKRFVLQ